ncbi:MAG: carbon-nitrogen hydrolase family protein [Methanobacteriota archaeon]
MAPGRLTVAALQVPHGATFEGNLSVADAAVGRARDRGAELCLLPEYWFLPLAAGRPTRAELAALGSHVVAFLASASKRHGLVVAGNALVPEGRRLYNRLFVFDRGRRVLSQDKVHLMPMESRWDLSRGGRFATARVRGVPTGALVCADILHPEAARILAILGARVVLVPVMSPRRPGEDETKGARESLFVARAFDNACYVVKAGGFGGSGDRLIAGRSFVAAPWGVVAKHRGESRSAVLVAELDLRKLEAFRKAHLALDRRVPRAYGGLLR